MSGLRFTLKAPPPQRLDLSPLVPARLAGLDPAAIARIAINTTRAPLLVGDVFTIHAGDPAAITFEGGAERFDRVGQDMAGGTLLLDGDAGTQLGRGMTGGVLEVRGSVGPHAASGLRGGHIAIAGNAGASLGGPAPGEKIGMQGGTVVVRGHAGPHAGDRLRRGLIVIEGDAGDAPGCRMVAGTLVVCGAAGALPGILMGRGTLLLGQPTDLPPTFVPSGGPDIAVFARLLARALEPLSPQAARLAAHPLRRFAGDNATLGKGEILMPSWQTTAAPPDRNRLAAAAPPRDRP
jgi:formylmethanofuran dehydrogenase subunit C